MRLGRHSHPDGVNLPVKSPTSWPGGPIRVEVIRNLDQLSELKWDWERLVRSSGRASAFSTAAAILTWYRLVESHSAVHVVTAWRGDQLVGLAPFSVVRLGPFRLFATAGAGYGYDGAPLIGAYPAQVEQAISDYLTNLVASGMAAIYLRRLPSDGTMLKILENNAHLSCMRMGADEARSIIHFGQMQDIEHYFSQVARKHAVPRRSRRLAERFGDVEYVIDDPEPGVALDAMRDMMRRRFDGDLRIFRTPQNRVLTRTLILELKAAGHAQISSMFANGQRITVTVDIHVGDRKFWWAVAYEPDLAHYSLGHIELYEFLRNAHCSGASEVDLGSAGFTYKQRWANVTRHYRTIAITAPRMRGNIANTLRRAVIRWHRVRRVSATAGPPAV